MSMMYYNTHSNIRDAIKRAESINVRSERYISLYRVREELAKRNIAKKDFMEYLYRYTSSDMHGYIDEVCNKLFDHPDEINCDERFLITSGLC
jgi:hypothetical protein